jgi:hypothetical protein
MRIFKVTLMSDKSQGESLTKLGEADRMISYYFHRKVLSDQLKTYVETGIIKKKS